MSLIASLPDESLLTKIKKKATWLYLLSFVVMPFSYLLKVIVSRELSVEDVGLMYSLLGFVGILSIYNDLGLTDALQYYIPKYVIQQQTEKLRGLLRVVVSGQFISGLLLGGGMYLGAERLGTHYFHSPEVIGIIKYFGLYFILLNFFQAMQSFYFSMQHVKLEKFIEFGRMGLVCLFTVLAWKTSLLTLQTFAFAWLIALVITFLASLAIFWKHYYRAFLVGPASITKQDLHAWLSYGFWSLLGANAWTIISQLDLQIILTMLGKKIAGYRTNFLSLSSLLIFAFIPLLSFCFPVFTELIEKKKYKTLQQARTYILAGIIGFGLILGVLAHYYGVWMSLAIFGDQYLVTGYLTEYSAWLLCTPLLGIVNFQYIRSFGNVRQVTIIQWIILIVHVLVSLLIASVSGNYYYLSLVLHLSHLAFFIVSELYIARYITPTLPT